MGTTMFRRGGGGRRRRQGAAIVEMALALGVVMCLTFGAIEFGYFFFVKNTLQGAAREGVRAAIPAAATNADVTAAVNAQLRAAGFNPAHYTIRIRNAADTANVNVASHPADAGVLVGVTATWGTVGLRPMGLIGAGKAVAGVAIMRKEAA